MTDSQHAMDALTTRLVTQWWQIAARTGAGAVRLYYRRDQRGPEGLAAMLASADAPGDGWQLVEGLALGAGQSRQRARCLIAERVRSLPLLYAENDGSRMPARSAP
jgi:hypothetical protein